MPSCYINVIASVAEAGSDEGTDNIDLQRIKSLVIIYIYILYLE